MWNSHAQSKRSNAELRAERNVSTWGREVRLLMLCCHCRSDTACSKSNDISPNVLFCLARWCCASHLSETPCGYAAASSLLSPTARPSTGSTSGRSRPWYQSVPASLKTTNIYRWVMLSAPCSSRFSFGVHSVPTRFFHFQNVQLAHWVCISQYDPTFKSRQSLSITNKNYTQQSIDTENLSPSLTR